MCHAWQWHSADVPVLLPQSLQDRGFCTLVRGPIASLCGLGVWHHDVYLYDQKGDYQFLNDRLGGGKEDRLAKEGTA